MRRSILQTTEISSAMLKQVRAADGISRVELARVLDLAPSTAGIYVDRLLKSRYLIETEENSGDAGRPPRILRPNPAGGEFIGVDFEARNIMAVAVDFADRPLRYDHEDIGDTDSAEKVVAKLEQAIAAVMPPDGSRPLAIGVGVPGVVDSTRGVALRYKYIRKWENIPLSKYLSEHFKVPVFLENNARSMALAELWFGQGKGYENFLCVGIRSGIGAGLILGGHLFCGTHYSAGELGRWRCPPPPPAVAPFFKLRDDGGGPELEEVASARSLMRALQVAIKGGHKTILSGHKTAVEVADFVRACQQGDALTLQFNEAAALALGRTIAQLCMVIDPGKVVLAGPLTALGDRLLAPVRSHIEDLLGPAGLQMPEIVNSTMGEYSGALGAAALALHEWKPVLNDPEVDRVEKPRRKSRARPA